MEDLLDMSVTLAEPLKIETLKATKVPRSRLKLSSLKEKLVKWCEETSAHGFANLPRDKHFIFKSIWFLMIAGAIIYSIIITNQFISEYYDYGKKTAYISRVENTIEFPAVTFCNLNPFNIQQDRMFIHRKFNKILEENNYNIKLGPKFNVTEINVNKAKSIINLFKTYASANKNNYFGNIHVLGFTLKQMLVSCFYNGRQCVDTEFVWSRDHEYGNCYSFNTNERLSLNTSQYGPKTGLSLELYMGFINDGKDFSIESGAVIQIHNRLTRPYLKRGLLVSTAVNTNIAVSRMSYKRLGHPYSKCRKNLASISSDSIYYNISNKNFQYSHEICKEVYIQLNFFMINCGCMNPNYFFQNKSTICHQPASIECLNAVEDRLNSDVLEISTKECPQECDELIYSARLDKATYPTTYYSEVILNEPDMKDRIFVKNTPSPKQIEKSFLRVNIFYKDNILTEIIESPLITSEILIGLIGGQFGLFLGASFVSFLEFWETLCSIIFIAICLRNKTYVKPEK